MSGRSDQNTQRSWACKSEDTVSAGMLIKDYICGKSVIIFSGMAMFCGRSVAIFGGKSGLYLVASLWLYLVAGLQLYLVAGL